MSEKSTDQSHDTECVFEGENSFESQSKKTTFRVNMFFATVYVILLAIDGICVAWTTGGNNQTSMVFAAKFDWTEADTKFYNSLLNFAS